jgi:hypothetical protein
MQVTLIGMPSIALRSTAPKRAERIRQISRK